MKYLVMECHEGYAVLMDEESRFVNAANLHYEVGQTVTDPILLDTEDKEKADSRKIVRRVISAAAAAACLAVVTVAGFNIFGREKAAPHSVVFVSAAAKIEMELDSNGSVVRLKSDSDCGNEIIEKYIDSHGKSSDKVDASSGLLAIQVEDGYISGGDTVDIIVSDEKKEFEAYKSELEDSASELDINVNVKKKESKPEHKEPPVPTAAKGKKEPPHVKATAPEAQHTAPPAPTAPPEPPKHEDVQTTAVTEQPTAPELPIPPVVPPDKNKKEHEQPPHEHPEPPTHPENDKDNGDRAGHGPAALPTPERPDAHKPLLTDDVPKPSEMAEAPAAPLTEETVQEADINDITNSQ